MSFFDLVTSLVTSVWRLDFDFGGMSLPFDIFRNHFLFSL
ncbi:hypothetical protein D927_00208 [Enterococcus faecalis 02-MB-BW-10]|nr:hypothetical protein D927_00208 [Enterococcus faecalis 02-MB-BW-10]